jgi:hypothetical protein
MAPRVAQVVGANRPDEATNQNPNPVGATEESINGPNARPTAVPGAGSPSNAGAPAVPVGGASGAPAPPPQTAARFYSPAAAAIVPPSYRGRPLEYASEQDQIADKLSRRAQEAEVLGFNAQGMRDQATAARARAQAVREAIAKDTALTPELRNAIASGAANPVEYEGAKEAAVAPYRIAASAIREGGRPVTLGPNQVVTTGATVNPELQGITEWASRRLGIPGGQQAQGGAASSPNATPAGQSAFTPRLVRNPDGSVASTVTPSTEAIQKEAAANYEKARESYNGAQTVKEQLASMEAAARKLNSASWSTTGTGAESLLQMARAVNTVWSLLGVKDQNLPFDSNAIASWQRLSKDTTRLGFALARTLGAREAMQVVQGAIKANPNVENTPLGFRMVLNAIRENAQRDNDYFEFATNFARTHGGDLLGAEVAFNKLNPPELYARRAIVQADRDIPQEAIEALRQNPKQAAAFDQHFGRKGLAAMFLGNASSSASVQ